MAGSHDYFSDGAAYDRRMYPVTRAAGGQFLDWLDVPSGLDWLDIGCGTGAFTELIASTRKPASLNAIDPAAAQLEFARNRAGLDGVAFRQGAAQALPYGDDSFDAVVMALVISFLAEPETALTEIVRVLRPGGRAGAYMWDFFGGGHSLAPFLGAARAFGVELPGPPVAESSRAERMRELWHGAGFERIETRPFHITVVHDNFDAFWSTGTSAVGPIGKALQAMSPGALQRLRDKMQNDLVPDEAGRITYPAHVNAVKGVRPT